MRVLPLLLVCTFACVSGPRPSAPIELVSIKNPASLPPLQCGRKGTKPVVVAIDLLTGNHLAITLTYPTLNEQFRYAIEEVRTLNNGHQALAGHKLANADGNDVWVDQRGSFLLFSGTPPRADDLNTTYRFVDATTQVHVDLETGANEPSGPVSMSVYLRCENLDAFIDALSAG